VQVLSKWWAAPAVYLLTVLGSIFIAVQLLPVVLIQTIMLARPHLEGSPSPLSLMQRRKIDAALSLPPSLTRATPLVPVEVPTVPLADYVARLDTAEVEDQPATPSVAAFELESQPSSIATERTKLRVARAEPRSGGVTAGDIFNRSFGVITAASN
jgi:hypothetical protein